MLKNNLSIRLLISNKGLKHSDVAEAMGVRPESFSRMLNNNLSAAKQSKIVAAIKKAEGQKNGRN